MNTGMDEAYMLQTTAPKCAIRMAFGRVGIQIVQEDWARDRVCIPFAT